MLSKRIRQTLQAEYDRQLYEGWAIVISDYINLPDKAREEIANYERRVTNSVVGADLYMYELAKYDVIDIYNIITEVQ